MVSTAKLQIVAEYVVFIVSLISFVSCLTLQKYKKLRNEPNFWDELQLFVTNGQTQKVTNYKEICIFEINNRKNIAARAV